MLMFDAGTLVAVLIVLRWIWTGMSVVSLVAGLVAWTDARADRRALETRPAFDPHGPRAIIANNVLRSTRVRIAIQTVFMLLGVSVITAPAPVIVHNQWVSVLSSCLFLFIEGLMMWDALTERYAQRCIDAGIDKWLREAHIAQGRAHAGRATDRMFPPDTKGTE